jgi:hypothetical protein
MAPLELVCDRLDLFWVDASWTHSLSIDETLRCKVGVHGAVMLSFNIGTLTTEHGDIVVQAEVSDSVVLFKQLSAFMSKAV